MTQPPLTIPEAFARACQLIHCDRRAQPEERRFLAVLAERLRFSPERGRHILKVCDLLNRDFVSAAVG
ncbi:MAG: hypothetical protein ACK6BG_04370 [Cyanobacteriota bacterium]